MKTIEKSEFEREFEKIFVVEYCPLCFYAEKFCGDSEKAKDIVSDVFLKIWINHKKIQINQSIKGYLYQCVHNDCLNYLEHEQMLKRHYRYMNKNLDAYDENDPLSLLISEEAVGEIDQAINSLPAKCKEIFILAKLDGYSYQEIAKKLNISMNTVNKQITRAMNKLRNELGNTYLKTGK